MRCRCSRGLVQQVLVNTKQHRGWYFLRSRSAADEAERNRGQLHWPYGTVPQWRGQLEFNRWGQCGTLVSPGYRGEAEYWVSKGWPRYPPWVGLP